MGLTEQQKKNRKQGIRATETESARESQRRAKEAARKRKYNPDGSLKKEFEKGFNN